MFRKLYDLLTLKPYRAELTANQKKQTEEIRRLYDQLFLSNPVLVVQDVQMYLPLFYTDHIQKLIYRDRNFYEWETLYYLQNKYGSFERILDIGSNIGNHMLYYCSKMNAKQVDCFEPNMFNYHTLLKNIELNHLQQTVTAHNTALGAQAGIAVQKDFSTANTGMNRIETVSNNATGAIPLKPLDAFGFSKIDFIKIDVEGFEADVLKGAVQTLQQSNAVVLIEVFDSNKPLVDELMLSCGYAHTHTIENYNCIYERR